MKAKKSWVVAMFLALALMVGSCGPVSTPQVVEKTVVQTVEVVVTAEPVTAPKPVAPEISFEEALACVQQNFPAERYMTNEYLPDPTALWQPLACGRVDRIKVGMPWVLNDEESPWYNAVELGYYEDMCLEVELVPGGPGKDHVQTLGGGTVDFAVAPGGQAIPKAVASRTPIDVVAIGTFLKGMPYCFVTVDPGLLNRRLTPLDLVGKTVGIQTASSEVYLNMLVDKYGIPREEVPWIEAGFTPDVILVDPPKADFYAAWVVNQPRLIEARGFKWNALMYRDWVYDEYSDVLVARRDTLKTEEGRDLTRRFLAATYQGVSYLLDHPEESAEIAVKYGVEAQVTKEQALWRFEHQKDLVLGRDALGLMRMNPEEWDRVVATLYQYGQIEVPGCEK